jgi:6-phospho-beta-glucosidase
MPKKKLCVLGGGGVRSIFVARTIARAAAELNLGSVVFFDVDAAKLKSYGGLAKEVARRISPDLEFTLETDAKKAIEIADYIITTVRVGGDASRVKDEEIISNLGLLAQETTGAGGFSMAMRSIPVISAYCQLAKEIAAPGHIILNFTNPAGLVTQALVDQGFPAFGLCDSPLLNVSRDRFSCNSFGLNHLTWFNEFEVDGKSVSKDLLSDPALFTSTEMRIFDPKILDISEGHLLNEYLYFYHYNKKAIAMFEASTPSRGDLIATVNKAMNAELSGVNVESDFDTALEIFFRNYNVRENNYMKNESGKARPKVREVPSVEEFVNGNDEGGYAGVAVNFIKAFESSAPAEMVLSTRNNGAIAGLEANDVVEVMCTVSNEVVKPRPQKNIPKTIFNLIATMKEYERLSVQAILSKDKNLAVKALMTNPLVANFDLASKLVTEFVTRNSQDSGEWK